MNEISIFELLSYRFFQHALLGGIIAAFVCAWIGLFLVLRKEAMIGDGIAHTAFGGIALGLWLGINPIITALLVTIIAIFFIQYMKKKRIAQSDAAIAVMLAIGFSLGLIIITAVRGFTIEISSYLFGSVLSIDETDILIITILGLIALFFLGLFHKELMSITFDEVSANLNGVPVNMLNSIFNLLVAFTIVLSIKIIGVILVVAILVLPALTALQLNLSYIKTTVFSIVIGMISMASGILLAGLYDNVSASGVIVFTAAIFFLFTVIYRRLG